MDPIVIGSLIVAGSAIVAPIINRIWPRSSKRRKRAKWRNCIVLAGISDTGKSTLIETLLPGVNARAGSVTQAAEVYTEERSVPGKVGEFCRTLLLDYRGQDTSQLTSYISSEEFRQNPPTAFVLLVDPFQNADPDADRDPDQARIALHLDQWSNAFIQGLAGILNEIDYSCLFINKIDALSADAEESIIDRFSQIFASLESSFSGITCDALKGSALKGTGLPVLQERIHEAKRRQR